MKRETGMHTFWFGTDLKRGRTMPRCSCYWTGEEVTDLTRAVLVWLEHIEWATKPGVRLQAEVWIDDAAFKPPSPLRIQGKR